MVFFVSGAGAGCNRWVAILQYPPPKTNLAAKVELRGQLISRDAISE
jgi:hypothetical protein